MTVTVTAVFPSLAAAQSAAQCMAIRPDKGRVELSLEHCDHGVTAAARMLYGAPRMQSLMETTPTCQSGVGRSHSAIIRVRCSGQLSDFVTRELAALGAEKISVTTPS